AKALLAEAGYDGTPIRWLTTREYPYLYTSAEYMKQSLEAIGMPVELVVSDWATLLQNRGNPDLWEIFVTTESTILHPVTRPWLDKAWPGFWDSAAKDELVTRLLETDPAEYQQVLDDWAQLIFDEVPFVKIGEFFGLRAHRAEVQGFVNTPEWLFWNVSLG
ncbi:MAG: ABC transporter substrate-binding protein, partial [Thermomicrobiales bacterium]|nr:ABC transporter substrate-binding protein [Thermomicrobiales bacterium]